MIIKARNVNDAFYEGMNVFRQGFGVPCSSRNGPVLEVPEPVITIYERPWERVLFDPLRDANPFFHFFEALWMLAGHDDVHFPGQFVKQMYEYSDDGRMLYGAYGFRWRKYFARDQIRNVISILRADHTSRRAVIAMWDPREDLGRETKDLPCNTHIYLKVRDSVYGHRLHMTVCCRSNDMIWGAYGANAVHFSVLQEYLADHIGVGVGPLVQISDSMHVYTENVVWQRMLTRPLGVLVQDPYQNRAVRVSSQPMWASDDWDHDLELFFRASGKFKHPWWNRVAWPMWQTFASRSLDDCEQIGAEDWRLAVSSWLSRRQA